MCYNVDRTISPLVHLINHKRELFVYILGLINDSCVQKLAHANSPPPPPESRGENKITARKERLGEGNKTRKEERWAISRNPPKISKLVNSKFII